MQWMGLSSYGIRASLAIFGIVLTLVILTLTSNFGHSNWFSNGKVLIGRVQNVKTDGLMLGEITQNITKNESGTKNFNGSKNNSACCSPLSKINHVADKLLDGLIIPSGFDEGSSSSCLSRYQSYLYRKASPHKPSPYLISKLRNYEYLHKTCGPHTTAYKRTMSKLNRHNNSSKFFTSDCKYLVWTAVNGLGNRMVSMASAFLYALLTDRVLLVEFKDDMVGLFCEPFPNSSWILPQHSSFIIKKNVETYQSLLKRDRENISSKEILPSFLHLKIQHTSGDHERYFSCDHSQNLLIKIPLLILQSDQYFIPSIFMVPSFSQEVSKMFPNKETVFHHLGRYLFLPSNELWGPITRFYQAYLAKADEKIGIQIRVFTPGRTPYQTILNQIMNCTQMHKILPNFGNEVSKNQSNYLKSVLVTSLYPEYGDNLKSMYLTKPTVTGEIIGVYQPSHEEQQKFGDNMHNKKAWIEMYLLSLCDVLVTSSLSTFGYVAQSMGGIKPWVLYKVIGNNSPNMPCVRDLSMEPCFHIPPKLDCMEKHIDDDVGKVFPYMRRCVDYGSGVKLVSDHQ